MSTIIEVKIIPKSTPSISINKQGELCIRLKSAPEKGKANQELIKLLSKKLKLPQSNIFIVSGLTSKLKRIHITGDILNKEELINRLLPCQQLELF